MAILAKRVSQLAAYFSRSSSSTSTRFLSSFPESSNVKGAVNNGGSDPFHDSDQVPMVRIVRSRSQQWLRVADRFSTISLCLTFTIMGLARLLDSQNRETVAANEEENQG